MSLVILPPTTITAAVANQLSSIFKLPTNLRSLVCVARLTYGSGGTNATAYLQTSLDDQTTWIDVVAWQFTTASAVTVANLSSITPVTTLYVPTDGTLTANTVKDGILGEFWRVKYTTTGTYAGGTTLEVRIHENSTGRP